MSDALFPDLIIGYDLKRKPIFSTKILTSISGRELRACQQLNPKYEFSINLPGLQERKGKLQQIENFFIARRGAFDSFLFKMPFDNEFDCTFVGDGTTTLYQLFNPSQMPIGNTEAQATGAIDPYMWNADDTKLMWSADDTKLMWTQGTTGVSKDGKLQLSEPLAVGQTMNVKGTYYYRCRFADDDQSFTLFSYRLWKGSMTLIGSLGNKI